MNTDGFFRPSSPQRDLTALLRFPLPGHYMGQAGPALVIRGRRRAPGEIIEFPKHKERFPGPM